MKKKIIALCILIAAVVSVLIFGDSLIRAYVSVFDDNLEAYAVNLLENEERTSDRYGLWKTKCYPEDGMVEFRTGGSGLAPSSAYKGFYYSADDSHKVFSAAGEENVSMTIDGDSAEWTDGTDNNGISLRITENWFWYEASF